MGSTLGPVAPRDVQTVLTRVYDFLTNTLRAIAIPEGLVPVAVAGTIGPVTPKDVQTVLTRVFDPNSQALRISVLGGEGGYLRDTDFPGTGLMVKLAPGHYTTTADNTVNWDTAYAERREWDGGPTHLDPVTGRASLGLGTMATQDAANVAITGGTITGVTLSGLIIPLAVPDGGTGLATIAQGDLLYGSAVNTISLLNKDLNATRYLSNTGASNNPAWSQVNLVNGVSGILPLANGGTNKNMVVANGGIVYSDADSLELLTPTAVANQVLLSGSSSTPSWSTATYPSTTTINRILYSSAANTITDLATAASSVLVTSGTGVPSISTDIPTAVTIGGAYIYRVAGTDVAATDGGTGMSAYTLGDTLYSSAANTLNALAGNITTTKKYLTQTGTGAISAVPVWDTIASSEITHSGLSGLTSGDAGHTQFALLAGRAGGQILNGGTGVAESLTLRATSGVGTTGSNIIFGVGNAGGTEAARFLHNGYFGVGINAPTSFLHIVQPVTTTGSPTAITVAGGAHTTLTASAESVDVDFNLARTVQFASGALAIQRASVFRAPTYGFVGASTITDAATLAVTGAPVKGANATITNTHGILIQAGAVSTATAAYGLTVNAPTGATANYAAAFLGGYVGINTATPGDRLDVYGVKMPSLFTDTKEPTGFLDKVAILSWVDGTYTFTITGNHTIYIDGVATVKTTASKQIADTTGLHWIYYNAAGVLSESTAHPGYNLPLVATVYWNTTTNKGLLAEERHGIQMDGDTHKFLHETVGTRYVSGLTGAFTNTTFSVSLGEIHDEDLEINIGNQTTCTVLYKNGAAEYEWDTAQVTPYKLNVANLRYNNGNNLADVPANEYVAYWIFATPDVSAPIVSLMGQRTDTNITNARNNNKYESLTLGSLPYQEMKLLYRVIYRNDATPYEETQDLRSVSNLPAGTYVATAHNVLTGLEWSLSGHNDTNFNINAGASSRVGIGTLSPNYLTELSQAGTVKAATDFLSLQNTRNAVDMDGTETGLLFRQYYYDAVTPAVVSSGRIAVGTETDWTSVASTQDSYMSFLTTLNGSLGEKQRITSDGAIDWTLGNVTYVPLGGDIQTYVNNAVAGDTLILASGQYIITTTITINKQLNIVGQGNAGFLTGPVTAGHGTLISSTTAAVVAFQINSDNVRICHLSINLTGNASTGINTANNLKGIVFTNIDVIVTCAGLAQGFTIYGSNAVFRDLTFYITSSNAAASGVWFWNDLNTTQNAICDCFNVTGTVVGAGSYAYAFVCENINDANTLTLNLSNSVCRTLAGTPLDIAVASISTTTSNSIVNTYLCTFEGADYDAYQNNSNQLNLGGSVLVNNLIFGTVTYRAAMASGLGVFGTTVTVPKVIGGTTTTSDLSLQTTSGVGTTGADMHFLVGNNGGTEAATILNSGYIGINNIAPTSLLHIVQPVITTGSPTAVTVAGGAHTTLAASVEAVDVNVNLARTVQFATGALATQRALVVQAPTYGFVGASTITDAATLAVTGAPVKGANATITNTHGILIQAGAVSTATNAYGLTVNAPTGATANYAAALLGKVGINTTAPAAQLAINGGLHVGGDSDPGDNDLLIDGTFTLPVTTSADVGVIYAGASRFIHNYKDATADGYNTFVGLNAGNFTMGPAGGASYLGSYNSAMGYAALYSNTTGYYNSAMGMYALYSNTTGYYNSAMGMYALLSNTTGYSNSAMGYVALYSNTTGYANSAMGMYALRYNTTGYRNSAMGYQALVSNTTGYENSAMGYQALYNMRPTSKAITAFADNGDSKTQVTSAAHGQVNTTVVQISGTTNYNGSWTIEQVAVDTFVINKVFVVNDATGWWGIDSQGKNNTALGYAAGDNITTGSSNIIIGANIDAPSATADNQINIGNVYYGVSSGVAYVSRLHVGGDSDPGDNNLLVDGTLTLTAMNVAGFVKNTAAGLLTGGNTLDLTYSVDAATTLQAVVEVAANAQDLSSELTMNGKWSASLYIFLGRSVATAFVGAGTEIRVETNPYAAGNADAWTTVQRFVGDIVAASEITIDNTEAVGATVIEIGATTPVVGDLVFFENSTVAESEWHKVIAINAGVDFTILDGLVYEQDAAEKVYNKAEKFFCKLAGDGLVRLRCVCNNANGSTNQNIYWRAIAVTTSKLAGS